MRTKMMVVEEECRMRGEKVWRRFDAAVVVVVGERTCEGPSWESIPLRLRRPSRASRRLWKAGICFRFRFRFRFRFHRRCRLL